MAQRADVLDLEEFVRRGQAAQAAVEAGTELPILPGASSVALVLPDGLTYEQWARTLRALGRVHQAMYWWVGDALRYGADRFGEMMAQASSEIGWTADQLMLAQRVAGAFVDVARRHAALTFSHHAAVAALTQDAADRWLAIAEEEKLSVHELRERIKAERAKTNRAGGQAERETPAVVLS